MRDTATEIGKLIREARERRGVTQAELATAVGKDQASVSQWEQGKRTPGVDDLMTIARRLEVELSELLPSDEPKSAAPALMRALFDTLELTSIRPYFDAFVDAAERKAAPPVRITVAADRPLRAADELLARAQQLEPDAVDAPIKVERLASLCGVRVLPYDFGHKGNEDERLSGLLIELDDGPVIGVQKSRYKPRTRFTIAHELGHHLLRHHSRFHVDLTTITSEGHSTSSLYDPRLEREANDFAANLLMPATLVRTAYSDSTSAKELAEKFGVSPLAMSYRLVNLGLKDPTAPAAIAEGL